MQGPGIDLPPPIRLSAVAGLLIPRQRSSVCPTSGYWYSLARCRSAPPHQRRQAGVNRYPDLTEGAATAPEANAGPSIPFAVAPDAISLKDEPEEEPMEEQTVDEVEP